MEVQMSNNKGITFERLNEISFHLFLSYARDNNITKEDIEAKINEISREMNISSEEKKQYLKMWQETI